MENSRQRPVNQRLTNSIYRAPGHFYCKRSQIWSVPRVVGLCLCLASVFLMCFKNVMYFNVKTGISRFKTMLHPCKKITATFLQRPLLFVSKMAFVERFDCILHKRAQLGEFQATEGSFLIINTHSHLPDNWQLTENLTDSWRIHNQPPPPTPPLPTLSRPF